MPKSSKAPTKQDAARIYKAVAAQHGGQVPKGSYASRIDAAAQRASSKK